MFPALIFLITCALVHHADIRSDSSLSSSPGDGARKLPQFHVAPMQCYTNAPMRHLLRLLSSDAVLWTEMEKVADLVDDADAFHRRFGFGDGGGEAGHCGDGVALQLGGNDPDAAGRCVRQACDAYCFDEIGLNGGCPGIETGGAAYGASLMKDPVLTAKMLAAIRTNAPDETDVSLKCRIAVYETMEKMLGSEEEEQYEELCQYVSVAEEAGISHLVLHARPVVLAGLSPTKNRQVPELDYDIVGKISRDFPSIKVTLNGGISGLSHFDALMSGRSCGSGDGGGDTVSSYMAGRWILRRPLDLAAVQERLVPGRPDGTSASRAMRAVERYVKYLRDNLSSRSSFPLSELCLPLYLVTEQLKEDYRNFDYGHSGKDDIGVEAIETMHDVIQETLFWIRLQRGNGKEKEPSSQINFKRLSSDFKGLVGSKVVNKWRRNRAEL